MRTRYLQKLVVAILLVSVAFVFLSAQPPQAGAAHKTTTITRTVSNGWCWGGSWWWWGGSCWWWWGNSWWWGGSMGSYGYNSYSTPSQYKLTVLTDPASLGTATGSGTFSQGSSASFSVTQSVIQSSSNTRYIFSHWSGDYSGAGNSGTVTMDGAKNIVAVYQLQYYLSVQAQQGAPIAQGQGWYNAGDTATLTIASQTVGANTGSRLVFQGWSIDGQSTQSGASLSLNMGGPHSVTGLYTQQYYLKVLTDQGVASGEGWYDAGTAAQIYALTPVSTNYGVNLVFNGWQGDLQSNSQSASVLMDKPKTAIATWRTDSTVLYLTIALGVIAALVAVGIIAFVARGRGPQPASASQAPPKKKSPEQKDRTEE